MLGTIEKAIMAANIGLTPVNNGEVIRINIPSTYGRKAASACQTGKK